MFALMALPAASFAQSATTRVRGNVYDQTSGFIGLGGLTVTVNCNGNIQTRTTDSYGLYVADFSSSACPIYAPVTSTVTYNGQTQQQTVFVSSQNTATLDFYYGSVAVPEFGLITGLVAAGGSGLAYLKMRKFS